MMAFSIDDPVIAIYGDMYQKLGDDSWLLCRLFLDHICACYSHYSHEWMNQAFSQRLNHDQIVPEIHLLFKTYYCCS